MLFCQHGYSHVAKRFMPIGSASREEQRSGRPEIRTADGRREEQDGSVAARFELQRVEPTTATRRRSRPRPPRPSAAARASGRFHRSCLTEPPGVDPLVLRVEQSTNSGDRSGVAPRHGPGNLLQPLCDGDNHRGDDRSDERHQRRRTGIPGTEEHPADDHRQSRGDEECKRIPPRHEKQEARCH
jgi:hypothetical protein